MDKAGNVFVVDSDHSSVMELPWTGYDYGAQVTLPFSGLSGPWGVIVDAAGNVFITDRGLGRVVKLQTQSVNFGSVYVCAAGQTTPSPCSSTLTLNYNVTTNGTLGYAAGADTGRTQS